MWPTTDDTLNPLPNPSQTQANYLSPQQQNQMGQYANALMTNQGGTPVKSIGAGMGQLGRALEGGMMMNQMYPSTMAGNSIFGNGAPQTQGNQPMQLASAGGGPSSIFSGLFGSSS